MSLTITTKSAAVKASLQKIIDLAQALQTLCANPMELLDEPHEIREAAETYAALHTEVTSHLVNHINALLTAVRDEHTRAANTLSTQGNAMRKQARALPTLDNQQNTLN